MHKSKIGEELDMTEFGNGKVTYKSNVSRASSVDSKAIPALIAVLAGNDGLARRRARESLVDTGRPAVVPLMEALAAPDSNYRLRWEAAKALSELGDPETAPVLVTALEDDRFGVRWLAAEGLISLGRDGLAPLLEALVQRSDSTVLRDGAHHVLRMLNDGDLHAQIVPVLAALEDVEPIVEVPVAAHAALDVLAETNATRIDEP
jgi:HEAT repeat protein